MHDHSLHCLEPHCNHPIVQPHRYVSGFTAADGTPAGLCPVHAKLIWQFDCWVQNELEAAAPVLRLPST